MTALTNHAEDLLLDWLLTTDTVTRPTAWYAALHTDDPGEAGSANEVSTGVEDADYARKSLTFNSAASGQSDSVAQVSWTSNASSPGFVISHISIWDALTSGNCLFKGALVVPYTMAAGGDTFTIDAGDIVAALD